MKIAFTVIFTFILYGLRGQITPLNSGTTVNLSQIFETNGNILIGGITNSYLVKSYNECNDLISLPQPAPLIYYNYFQRLDTDNIFLISKGNNAILYRSYDGGTTWLTKWTTSYAPNFVVFFDSLEGVADKGYGNTLLRTYDGGATWPTTLTLPIPSAANSLGYAESYGDSVMIFGEYGQFFISKDRGHTWPIVGGGTAPVVDFFFLNMDTIFGVTSKNNLGEAYITKSTNGGATWTNSFAPIPDCRAIVFRTRTEGYVVGRDFSNQAVIAKTTDMGQSWSRLNLGISGALLQIVFLNDSIAILTGTQGLLLRWNYTNAVFTGIKENNLNELEVNAYPNPVKDYLKLAVSENIKIDRVTIFNPLGQTIYTLNNPEISQELNLGFLPGGIYFIQVEGRKGQKILKIIKENY